jgi:O-antigen ligase
MFALTIVGTFLCYNRGAWLALAGALVVLLLERDYRRILVPVLVVGMLAVLVYWQAISASAVVAERLSNVSSIRFRLDLLAVSQELIRDHPLFGVGIGNFSYYFLDYGGHWETLAYDLPTPHNTFVLVLSSMGLVCFLPYALIFVRLLANLATAMLRSRVNKEIDRALLVSGVAVIAVYVLSSLAVDLYVNVFSSLVFFAISGTIAGYVKRLPPVRRRAAALRQPPAHIWRGGAAG